MNATLDKPVVGEQMLRSSGPAMARKPNWHKDAIRSLIREATRQEPAEGAEGRVLEILGTDETPDRYNTVLKADGWMLDRYRQNPVFLWCHDDTSPPIGLTLDIRNVNEDGRKGLVFLVQFADAEASPLADRVFRLYKGGFLNATSVGFWPHETREIEDEDEARELGLTWPYLTSPKFPPIVHERSELLELSAVPVPGNPNALVQRAMSAGWLKAEEASEVERMLSAVPVMRPVNRPAPGLVLDEPVQIEPRAELTKPGATPGPRAYRRRLNPQLPRNFDVARESLQPATVMCAWASKYLGCEVKDIYLQRFSVPMVRIGGFLAGLRHATSALTLKAARNILENGTELPPVRAEIQLNSKVSDSFLIDGAEFFEDGNDRAKFIVAREPCWCCLEFTVMARAEHADHARAIQDGAWRWLRANDPLKGEAFSITGEFQKRGDLTLDDVFSTERNTSACKRALAAVNAKGAAVPARGIILAGPPGTGKTLSLRAIRDQARATFLWVSAKDLRYFGGCTGIETAFEYGRELAPSVIGFEDIDSWIGDSAIDLLKVEMDGVAKSAGLLTILTTNFPERLPDALIDRPGRFHDVLNFDLPDETVREAMVRKWIGGLTDEQVAFAVESTAGMSGAHVRYVADFVTSIVEADGLAVGDALVRAVETIREQRELVKSLRGPASFAVETISGSAATAPVPLLFVHDESCRAAVDFAETTKADEGMDWDAATAEARVRAWAGGDEPDWKKYRQAFAWYDAENAETFGAYKLPHHDVADGRLVVVWRGVAAAMAALHGGRSPIAIPTDQQEAVHNHLAKHYAQFDKEPPEFTGRAMEETDMTMKEMLAACAAACDACSAACKAAAENETDETKAAALEACIACKAACAECAAMLESGGKAPEPEAEPAEEKAMKAVLEDVARRIDAVAA